MLRPAFLATILAAGLCVGNTEAMAWGQTGHRVTGAIAEQYLSAEAQAAVRQILGSETLAEASTWPDFMRSSPEAFWRTQAGPWHYVTVPDGSHYHAVGAPPEGDAVTALERFTETLKTPAAALADRQLALRFAVHIIGDLHQPLHVGNGTDRGGNDIKLHYHGEPTNLHSVWDSGIIKRQELSYTEWAAWLTAKITADQLAAWSVADPQVWISESAAIRPPLYPADSEISWKYEFLHLETVRLRLSQAGVRIATYLNEVFGQRRGPRR